jgi:hypothetical protein
MCPERITALPCWIKPKTFYSRKSENMSNTCNTNVTQKKGLEEAINCVQKKKKEVINNSKEYIDT